MLITILIVALVTTGIDLVIHLSAHPQEFFEYEKRQFEFDDMP